MRLLLTVCVPDISGGRLRAVAPLGRKNLPSDRFRRRERALAGGSKYGDRVTGFWSVFRDTVYARRGDKEAPCSYSPHSAVLVGRSETAATASATTGPSAAAAASRASTAARAAASVER